MGKIIKTPFVNFDIDDITLEDMPNEILKEIYGLCGKEFAVLMMKELNGVTIQVPSRPFVKIERKIALRDFDGTTASIRKIARTYSMTEARIRELLKKERVNVPVDNQLGLFGAHKNEK